jgi:tetratricopeptide (TPR) repeat protein
MYNKSKHIGFLKKAANFLVYSILCIQQLYAQDFKIDDKIPIPIPGLSPQKTAEETEANFIEGMKYYMLEQYDKALVQFMAISSKKEDNSGLLYQIAATHAKLKNNLKAIEYAQKAYKLDEKNSKYGQLAAGLLAAEGKYEAAADIYKKMYEANPESTEIGLDLAAVYFSLGAYDKVQKVYSNIEKNMGVNAELTHHRQGIYMKMGKINEALQEGQKLIDAEPTDIQNYIDQAELFLKNNKETEAGALLEKAQKIDSRNGQIHLLKAEIAKQKADYATMYEELTLACADKNLDENTLTRVIITFFDELPKQADSQGKEKLINYLIEKQPNQPMGYLLMGDHLFKNEKLAPALEQYQKALQYEKANNQLWSRVLALCNDLKKYPEAIKLAEQAIELYPNQAIFWYYKGAAHHLSHQYTVAAENLEEAQRLSSENKDLLIVVQSFLGETYNRLGKHELSDHTFDELLANDPNNDGIRNNYAYYLALRKANLDKSVQLIEPVIERNPSNATFLDTYGWVLFVRKEYNKAKDILQKAYDNSDKKSSTILDHLADAHYQTGDKLKAIEYWKKAAEISPNNKEIAKKIAEGRLVE